jgi:ribosome-associated protein
MSKKPKRGYYVKGHFVAEGSELDKELKAELKGTTDMSKTDLKRHSDHLQQLGEQLVNLRKGLLEPLNLSERLLDALVEAKRITNFEGLRRHMQLIGKLMRLLDKDTVAAIEQALETQHKGSAQDKLNLHQAEQWRDKLIASDESLEAWLQWCQTHAAAQAETQNLQQLRQWIRQVRKDQEAQAKAPAGQAVRHGKAYRELFQHIKHMMQAPKAGESASNNNDDDADAEQGE